MGTMRTINYHKLIAEFMGYKKGISREANANLVNDADCYYYINSDWVDEFNLRFDLDWNWLIPAVIKCKELQFFGSNSLISRLNDALIQADIELVHEQVIEFINYYNKQQHESN